MRIIILILSLILCNNLHAQIKRDNNVNTETPLKYNPNNNSVNQNNTINAIHRDSIALKTKRLKELDTIAKIEQYEIINIDNVKTHVDTTLQLKHYYTHHNIQRDNFALLSTSNDGKQYSYLDYALKNTNDALPQIGFQARNLQFLHVNDIHYYHVPTAYSRLFFRTAIKQGQNVDAFITTNISPELNLFIGYRGLRSLGAYIHDLSSIGNFQFGGSYDAKKGRYGIKFHWVSQDLNWQENGGIINPNEFVENEGNRERIDVYLRDAYSIFKNNRIYFTQFFNILNKENNKLKIQHVFKYDYYSNRFAQPTIISPNTNYSLFGNYYQSSVYDVLRNKNLQNQFSFHFENNKVGNFSVFADVFTYTYNYNSIVVLENQNQIPNELKGNLLNIGGQYTLKTKYLNIDLYGSQSITTQKYTDFRAKTFLNIAPNYQLSLFYQFTSQLPHFTAQLFQSHLAHYNWFNNFNNEKKHDVNALLKTPFINVEANYQLLTDKIYYSNDNNVLNEYGYYQHLEISPKQYANAIHYFSIKANKEFYYKKWSLNNTIQFQQAIQTDDVINVPMVIGRHSLYYSNYFFRKALFTQMGTTLRYFTKYNADGYISVLGNYYVQNIQKIGNYPMIDLFINMKIKTAKIFVAAEQVNSLIGKSHHFTSPNYPYRDFTVRLGLQWNFFN